MAKINNSFDFSNDSMGNSTSNHETVSKIFNHNNHNVTFKTVDGVVYVNATEMAKIFNKSPYEYLRSKLAKELISRYTEIFRESCNGYENQLVITVRSSPETGGGTWLYEDVALDFSRWLNVNFRVWCNFKIKELLTKGYATLGENGTEIMSVVSKKILENEELKQRIHELEERNGLLEEERVILKEKADYYDEFIKCDNSVYTKSIVAELHMTSRTLNSILYKEGVINKSSNGYVLAPKYMRMGYESYERKVINRKNGTSYSKDILKWKPKGIVFVKKFIKRYMLGDPQLTLF